jgi:hypothetical protein
VDYVLPADPEAPSCATCHRKHPGLPVSSIRPAGIGYDLPVQFRVLAELKDVMG